MISLRFAPLVLAAGLALAVSAVAGAGRVVLTDSLAPNQATRVSVTVRKSAAFDVVLRAPKQGRTKLFLLGQSAPQGSALIDTKTYACGSSASTRVCRGRYDALPAGTYTFRIVVSGLTPKPAPVTLTVSW